MWPCAICIIFISPLVFEGPHQLMVQMCVCAVVGVGRGGAGWGEQSQQRGGALQRGPPCTGCLSSFIAFFSVHILRNLYLFINMNTMINAGRAARDK